MRIFQLGYKGNDVMEIQALLKKIGYSPGPIDGIFGIQTKKAVKEFQQDNGLTADGIIGPKTYALLESLFSGYDVYTVRAGDTIYQISKKYYSNIANILAANPDIEPNNIQIGQRIIVPYGISIVDTNINYTYDVLKKDVEALKVRYPFLEIGSAGKSVLGRALYYIKIGEGPNQVFFNGAHHALEWITSPLLMKFIENFSQSYVEEKTISGYDAREIFSTSTIYIIPMVNPDGIDLVLNGLSPSNPYYDRLLEWNNGSSDFSQNWQANNCGVDLNHNYDALWETGKKISEEEYGIYGPGPTRYPGTYPESEPESKAVADFSKNHDFRLVIAYHSQGQVIYWDFQNLAPPEAKAIGELFAKASGYELEETYGITAYGGYKDWFIDKYRRPGYTIEVGLGENPLQISEFPLIYQNNIEIMLLAPLI